MDSNKPPTNFTDKQKKELEKEMKEHQKDMQKKFSLVFTKAELVIIFNVLLNQQYRIGDAHLLYPAVKKIEAVIAVTTNIPSEQQGIQPSPESGEVILEEDK